MITNAAAALALGTVLLMGAPALAKSRKEGASQDPNRVICRTDDSTGSRLRVTKTCMTATQWDRLEHDQREVVERVQAARTSQSQ